MVRLLDWQGGSDAGRATVRGTGDQEVWEARIELGAGEHVVVFELIHH